MSSWPATMLMSANGCQSLVWLFGTDTLTVCLLSPPASRRVAAQRGPRYEGAGPGSRNWSQCAHSVGVESRKLRFSAVPPSLPRPRLHPNVSTSPSVLDDLDKEQVLELTRQYVAPH